MSGNVNRLKFKQLKEECELLVRQIEAVSDDLTRNTDPETRTLLEYKQERLLSELSQKENQLGELEAAIGEEDTARLTGVLPGRISNTYTHRNHRPPQEVFPYLLDRNEQEERLLDALTAHKREKPTRPFVCVVHGDELECHMLYLNRVKMRSLPEILRGWYPLEVENTPIEPLDIQLPVNKGTKSEYDRSLWNSLRAATHGRKLVSDEDIIESVASNRLSVMIRCSVLTEDLNRYALQSIDWFFKFWEEWPEISNLLLLVAISFKYHKNRSWARHPIKSWSRTRLNQQLLQYLNQLDFSQYSRLYGTVLPELAAIRRSDAEALIRHEEVSPYSNLDDRDIRMLYGNPTLCTPDGSIPMETLLDQLTSIYDTKRRHNLRRP